MAIQKIECRRVGSYDSDEVSYETGFSQIGQVSRTQQSQAADTDINKIVKQFKVTGLLPQGVRRPLNADFVDITDFRSAMNAIIQAERSFSAMPSSVRNKFGNNPAAFVEFCSDEKNIPQLREWGLAVPETAKPEPMEVRVINPTPMTSDGK